MQRGGAQPTFRLDGAGVVTQAQALGGGIQLVLPEPDVHDEIALLLAEPAHAMDIRTEITEEWGEQL